MRKVTYLITALILGVSVADAAVRDANSVSRSTPNRTESNQKKITARTTAKQTVARTATSSTIRAPQRTATTRAAQPTNVARTATQNKVVRTTKTDTDRTASRSARATVTLNTLHSNTFGTGYNTCREAYFTCMDQFCGTANDKYRRCVCSSRLSEIQSREHALTQASDQLTDFKNLNLTVIDKTAAEVGAMTSASIGEYTQSITTDKSASATQLANISDILSKTKSKSLSTSGTLDIAGNINEIWATADLAGGANIANLTGEALYNAVHAQCSQMVIDKCPDKSTQTMVMSAYGMYIENDCSMLINNLDKQLSTANDTIRSTEHEMNIARLKNYNAHNSTSINDCIAQVRADITADTACGTDYVHCLDITGRYLNIETGEPIYSPNFYQLESQISLAGDILTNQTNRLLVSELNRKRDFAKRGLDTCRDLADDVWDEFLRQAITEIYQGQQERIRTVKNECLDVVNNCYDEQTQSLKNFSNIKEQLLLGSRLELSEQMCQEKLDACSNLYGGGTHGMAELITAMHNITNQKIAKECQVTLKSYAQDMCSVPSSDSLHSYPYACRVYAPGDQIYASIHECNLRTHNANKSYNNNEDTTEYLVCPTLMNFTSCNPGYYLTQDGLTKNNICKICPQNHTCDGGTKAPIPQPTTNDIDCGDDYIGSLYHKLARYAMQTCVRPSESNNALPTTVLQDINVVMDKIRTEMANTLSDECERLGGRWVDIVWIDKVKNTTCCANGQCTMGDGTTKITDGCHDITGDIMFKTFYSETSANTKWGYCATPKTQTITTTTNSSSNTNTDTETESSQ